MMIRKRLAVDVGGTFIDFVLFDEATGTVQIEKVPSSGRLERRVMEGIDQLGAGIDDVHMIIHGSTLVVNTILQETGARIGLITTQGFRDVYELGRGNRAEIYNLFYRPPKPLVPRYLRYEVCERINARGEVLEPLDESQAREIVRRLKADSVEGIAIVFLHAYANPTHERRMAQIAEEEFSAAVVSISSDIVREWREFERTSTTVLNAYTRPRLAAYLAALDRELRGRDFKGTLNIMQSSGGMTSSTTAQNVPIRTLESGPAGGVIGAAALGQTLNVSNLVSADVGGTTFDVALIVDGQPFEKAETIVNGRPVLQPTIDVISIGAGGGSIAWLDDEGGLRVGPRSAQANPGPVCFGLGGTEPTVTDAQVVLGYLDPHYYLGNRMALDRAAAEGVVHDKIAAPLKLDLVGAAYGIYHLAAMNMTYAMRNITVERGRDPRQFNLICFGGGGGLFAGHLLNEMQCAQAIIPVNPANFSAWGLLNADYREDLMRMFTRPLARVERDELEALLGEIEAEARQNLTGQGMDRGHLEIVRFADMRYLGQEHTVRVPLFPEDLSDPTLSALRRRFDGLYEQAYAHVLPEMPVEFVRLRVAGIGLIPKPQLLPLAVNSRVNPLKGSRPTYFSGDGKPMECPVYDRTGLNAGANFDGPALVEEWTSTTLVLPGQNLRVDDFGNLIMTRNEPVGDHNDNRR